MRWIPIGLVLLLSCLPHSLAEPPKTTAPAPQTIRELVADLGDPDYRTREQAQRELWQRGDSAIPALEKAATSDNPEVARRARELLDKFSWGIRPDTLLAVVKLVRQFQSGDLQPDRREDIRKQAITDLLKMGRPGLSVVRAILKKDLPEEARAQLTLLIVQTVRREVPRLLMAAQTDAADELISLHATGTTSAGAEDFAAYHMLRGDLPAVIKQCEEELKAGRRTAEMKLLLTHLYRADGQWVKARAAAVDIPRGEDDGGPGYKEQLLEDEGNWAALADLPYSGDLNHPDAVKLSLLRLAGRKEKFDALAKKIRTDADEFTESEDVMNAAVALLANHRADEATGLLLEKRKNLALLSEVLLSRMRYKAALDLIGPLNKEQEAISPSERMQFNLRRARVLMLAGERDSAVQLFEEVARGLEKRLSDDERTLFSVPARALVRTELRLGLRDLACEHAAQFVPPEQTVGTGVEYSGESPFELLFPHDSTAAEVLFHVLRANKVPGDIPGATMIRTRDLLSGTASNAAVDQAAKLLREAAEAIPLGGDRLLKARRYLTLAQVLRIAKHADDAANAFKVAAELTANTEEAADAVGARSWVYGTSDPARVWLEWGDFLADSGRPRDAAAVYEAGWKLFPNQPLPLFLSGQTLVNMGDKKEGERRIELSHWVSLGNERLRGRFLDELVRRGETTAIKREIALILKACWSRDHFFGNVMNQCARGSNLVGDFTTAELCGQRSLLVVLRSPGVYFVDTAAYLNVPLDLLVFHAKAELAAGKIDDAMATARHVLTIAPGHLELVCGMVPELDKRNRKKEADELFKLGCEAYQKMLVDYPNSPAARHALAQLSAHSQRKLDDGLKYAKAAVAFDPGSPQYRETLAEVHFRRGDRDEALKLMQKLADEQPRNAVYRRQLMRYRTAAFDSPWPYAVDD